MQDQFYGFPKRGMEPQLWRPRVSQAGSYSFVPNSVIPLRKPADGGQFMTIGQWVNAQATVTFDGSGTPNVAVVMELPLMAHIPDLGFVSTVGTATDCIVVGSYYYGRSGGVISSGVITTAGAQVTFFRAGVTTSDNAFGASPAMTVTAGDRLGVSLGYFASV